MNPKHILLSRIDKIGDVILTLPIAGVLKREFPGVKISFLGSSYTESIIKNSEFIDDFVNWDEIKEDAVKGLIKIGANVIIHVYPIKEIADAAKNANIAHRIGTSHRVFHWWTCNSLVNLGRKHNILHEAQLNLQLLRPLNIKIDYDIEEIPEFYGWKKSINGTFDSILEKGKFNLILHAKSKGSAREWPLKNYLILAQSLQKGNFNIILTGTKDEGEIIIDECAALLKLQNVKNITGKIDLSSYIELIKKADGLVACSTGPLHIAAASGINALGLYPPIKPMHPGRWAPLGSNASYLVKDTFCNSCRNGSVCLCLNEISPESVKEEILKWYQVYQQSHK